MVHASSSWLVLLLFLSIATGETNDYYTDDYYWCSLLELSDTILWELAISRQIGTHCWIYVSPSDSGNACEFFVKGRPELEEYNGLPLTRDGLGTGCVAHSSSFCYYHDTAYNLTQEERDSMCTDSIVGNAVAQLKYGIRNGKCADDPAQRCRAARDLFSLNKFKLRPLKDSSCTKLDLFEGLARAVEIARASATPHLNRDDDSSCDDKG